MSKRFSYDDGFTYVCDPLTWKGEHIDPDSIKQVQLYCSKCSVKVNITEENSKTLPAGLITLLLDKCIFKHSPIYGGLCLRPECGNINKQNCLRANR